MDRSDAAPALHSQFVLSRFPGSSPTSANRYGVSRSALLLRRVPGHAGARDRAGFRRKPFTGKS